MERKTPLRRFTALVSKTPLKRTAFTGTPAPASPRGGAHRRRRTRAPRSVEDLVVARDEGCCLIGGEFVMGGQRGRDWSIAHRIPRGMGGTRREVVSSPANLFLACGDGTTGCHGHSEANRTLSYARGWLLHRDADPAVEPIFVALGGGRWQFLTADGRRVDQLDEGVSA